MQPNPFFSQRFPQSRPRLHGLALSTLLVLALGAAAVAPAAADPASPEAAVGHAIGYQGVVTDASGQPLEGTVDLAFQVWDAATGGNHLGADIIQPGLPVEGGLFHTQIDLPNGVSSGRALWLRVRVDGEWLAPRQPLLAAPYALTLAPGARVYGDQAPPVLDLMNEGLGTALRSRGIVTGVLGVGQTGLSGLGDVGVRGEGLVGVRGLGGLGTGVEGEGGTAGVAGTSIGGPGVQGESQLGDGVAGTSSGGFSAGVSGRGATGVFGLGALVGVSGFSAANDGTGVMGVVTATGGTGVQGDAEFGTGLVGNGETGIIGNGSTGAGVEGNGSVGVAGHGTGIAGVLGTSTDGAGVRGESVSNDGVVGSTAGGAKSGVFGVNTSSGAGITARSDGGNSLHVPSAGGSAVWIQGATAHGVHVEDAGAHGIDVKSASLNGVQVYSAGSNGIQVVSASRTGLAIDSADVNGIQIASAGRTGLAIDTATEDAIRIASSGKDAIRISSAGWNGLAVDSASYAGVYVASAGGDGVRVQTATKDGLRIFDGIGRDYIHAGSDADPDFRVANDGLVLSDRGFRCGDGAPSCLQSGGADLAEKIDASEPLAPGDVVEIDPTHPDRFRLARGARSRLVAGVISSAPAVVLGAETEAELEDPRPALALVGRVPVKVSAENGPIAIGDLLVSAETPGHAMRETVPTPGTVLGKALEPLPSGTGTILVLVQAW